MDVDRGLLEKFGPFGISKNIYSLFNMFGIGVKENFHMSFYNFFILLIKKFLNQICFVCLFLKGLHLFPFC